MQPIAYSELSVAEHHHWWFRGRRNILSSLIDGLRLPQHATILEAGAGTGGNLAMLAGFGQVSAFEQDFNALAYARNHADSAIRLSAGSCPEDVPFGGTTFDLICMIDVLEHIDDHVLTLNRLKSMLNPTGRLLLTVPAYGWLWSNHDVFLGHKRRYTKASLTFVCQRAGLRVDRITFFNTLLFMPIAMLRLVCILLKCAPSVGGVQVGMFNELLCRVFSLEATLMKRGNLPFGVSLACVATLQSDGAA